MVVSVTYSDAGTTILVKYILVKSMFLYYLDFYGTLFTFINLLFFIGCDQNNCSVGAEPLTFVPDYLVLQP